MRGNVQAFRECTVLTTVAAIDIYSVAKDEVKEVVRWLNQNL